MEGHPSILLLALVAAGGAWLAVTIYAVAGRAAFDRRSRVALERPAASEGRVLSQMLRRAGGHRTARGKWRRISALRTLVHARDLRSHALLGRAVVDRDPDVVAIAVQLLGELGDAWAVGQLIEILRSGRCPRSRVATQLDAHTPAIGRRLIRLLRDDDPQVRFWGATLLARCPGVARARLVELTTDPDPNVRAAAVEAIGERRDSGSLAAVEARLADDEWFVRVHACRAVGRLGGLASAPAIAPALRDRRWWVRAAAKDALRELGPAVAGVLIPMLEDEDAFARNGAAEVLQDVGFVDGLGSHGKEGDLLERILTAGGEGMREAARRRATDRPPADQQTLGRVAS